MDDDTIDVFILTNIVRIIGKTLTRFEDAYI